MYAVKSPKPAVSGAEIAEICNVVQNEFHAAPSHGRVLRGIRFGQRYKSLQSQHRLLQV